MVQKHTTLPYGHFFLYGPVFCLREASSPPVRPPAALAALLSLRGRAIPAPAGLTMGDTRGLHRGDRVPLILLLAPGASGLEVAPGVWAPRRGGKMPVSMVAALGVHALQDGTLAIRAFCFQRGSETLVFSSTAFWLGQAHFSFRPPKLAFRCADDGLLLGWRTGWLESLLRGLSLLTVCDRLVHCSFKRISSVLTFESGLWGEREKKQQVEAGAISSVWSLYYYFVTNRHSECNDQKDELLLYRKRVSYWIPDMRGGINLKIQKVPICPSLRIVIKAITDHTERSKSKVKTNAWKCPTLGLMCFSLSVALKSELLYGELQQSTCWIKAAQSQWQQQLAKTSQPKPQPNIYTFMHFKNNR